MRFDTSDLEQIQSNPDLISPESGLKHDFLKRVRGVFDDKVQVGGPPYEEAGTTYVSELHRGTFLMDDGKQVPYAMKSTVQLPQQVPGESGMKAIGPPVFVFHEDATANTEED
ncbi:MAG: hypothetical protein KKF41_08605 [Actinobacteria bacterium]|nr:hypothetical protein [Actinomycetota bacterium]MBU1942902.1 hypothetical protein [Actinomycetota bacterium]MBU2687634.1 hypothetical protein [Actinomycetota bacterium]